MSASAMAVLAAAGIVASATVLWATAAHAESPYERNQREQLEKYQQQHGLSPQAEQAQRWQREWRQQRQAELQREYLMSKQHQQQILALRHITWTPQQWREWDREYDLAQQRQLSDRGAKPCPSIEPLFTGHIPGRTSPRADIPVNMSGNSTAV